jgi:hypothetical protein
MWMAAQSCTWLPGSIRSGIASDLPQHSTGRSSPSLPRVPKRTAESEDLPSTESSPRRVALKRGRPRFPYACSSTARKARVATV